MDRLNRKPPRSAEAWTGYLFYWAYRNLELAYWEAMSDLHLSLQQIGILQLLQDEGATTQSEIVRSLGLDKGAASRDVRNLEEQELVSRRRQKSGQREVLVELRDKGRGRLADIQVRNDKVTRQVFRLLTPKDVSTLHGLLRKITGLEDQPVSSGNDET